MNAPLAPAHAESGRGMARAASEMWLPDDTERWLTDFPLPVTFQWNGTRAYPRYTLKKGYGFWLRTAGPYHAALRGLFVLCHELLAGLPVGAPLPTPDQLAALLTKQAGRQAVMQLSAEDLAPIAGDNPAENVPSVPEENEPAF